MVLIQSVLDETAKEILAAGDYVAREMAIRRFRAICRDCGLDPTLEAEDRLVYLRHHFPL
jgi:hypothetical protein